MPSAITGLAVLAAAVCLIVIVVSVWPAIEAEAAHVDIADYHSVRTDLHRSYSIYDPALYRWQHEISPLHKPTPEWYVIRDIGRLWNDQSGQYAIGMIQHMVDSGHFEIAIPFPINAQGNTTSLPLEAVYPLIREMHAAIPVPANASETIACRYDAAFCEGGPPPLPTVINLTKDGGYLLVSSLAAAGNPVYVHNASPHDIELETSGNGRQWEDPVRPNGTLAYTVPGTYTFGSHNGTATLTVQPR